jgi:hypothetical protein
MTEDPRRRDFAGRSLAINLLRAVHVVAMVGCGSGVLNDQPLAAWTGYAWALFGSGAAILLLDRWANPAYFRQLDGLAVLLKLVLLAGLTALAGAVPAFWSVLVLSVLATHAPGRLRHWRWLRR